VPNCPTKEAYFQNQDSSEFVTVESLTEISRSKKASESTMNQASSDASIRDTGKLFNIHDGTPSFLPFDISKTNDERFEDDESKSVATRGEGKSSHQSK
jgi:hypothetical protein